MMNVKSVFYYIVFLNGNYLLDVFRFDRVRAVWVAQPVKQGPVGEEVQP